MNFDSDEVKGRTEPRIHTPALVELTPDTSYGFDVIEFAEEIGWPLDDWEKWAVIHFGELNPDGTPRFRFVLILVARQNGKTTLCRVLTLYWMFIECHELIIGTSTSREKAKASWRAVIKMANGIDILKEDLDPLHTRETIGEENFFNRLGSNYKFAAPNRRAGRGDTVDRVILDELREHRTTDAYDALINAGNAVKDFQAVAITNQGDSESIVLDDKRTQALEFIETGNGDPTLFLAEWSSPNGADPTDPHALAYANPNLGKRIPLVALMGQAIQAKKKGGVTLNSFKTEVMCQKVTLLDSAIDPELWNICAEKEPINLANYRRELVLCMDVSMTGDHATLVACAKIDGMLRVEVVKAWSGFGCTKLVRAELPDLVEKVKPRAIGWYPGGPAAAIAADLKARPSYNKPWPPRNVKVIELKAETVPSICMGLADTVHSVQIQHPSDEMLTAHVRQTQKLKIGDVWKFTRAGSQPVDATYALAGAVHLARILPEPLKPVSTGRESTDQP
jgi:hypothetical protein